MGKGILGMLGLRRRPKLSLAEFRELAVEEVLTRRPDAPLNRVGDSKLELAGAVTDVARGYEHYLEHGELKLLLRQLGDLVLYEPPKPKAEDLIVLVRPKTFLPGDEGAVDRGLALSLPNDLAAIVALDTPDQYVFPFARDLRDGLGLGDAAIWDRARVNLRQRIDLTPPTYQPGKLMGVTTDMGLAASLLIEDDYWNAPALATLGDLVVAPVERDELVIVPLREPGLIAPLRTLVASRSGSQFLSDALLLRRNGAWETFP